MIRIVPILLATILAAPAATLVAVSVAEAQVTITHGGEGRFGVSYGHGAPGRAQVLAGAAFTTTLTNRTDGGTTFSLSLTIEAGNIPDELWRRREPLGRGDRPRD